MFLPEILIFAAWQGIRRESAGNIFLQDPDSGARTCLPNRRPEHCLFYPLHAIDLPVGQAALGNSMG